MTDKKRRLRWAALAVLLAAAAAGLFMLLHSTSDVVVGGRLHISDFKDGYQLYIVESFTLMPGYGYENAINYPPPVWHITDEDIRDEIYGLCSSIESYRALDPFYDVLLGGSDEPETILPTIYFECQSCAYCIRFINWETFQGEAWDAYLIRQERGGQPTATVERYDLRAKPDSMSFYDYIEEYSLSDSLIEIEDSRWSWYSKLSQEDYDALMPLLYQIDVGNAERFK